MEPAVVPSPGTARCPSHPERIAVAACTRCGSFICESCAASVDPPFCAPCFAKRGIPLLAEPFSFGGAFGGSFKLFLPVVGPILGACAIVAVPLGLLNWFMEEQLVGTLWKTYLSMIAGATVGLIAVIASLALMTRKAEGRDPTFGWAMGEGVRAWPRVFGARFVAGVKILLWTLLLIIPGIVKGVRLSMVDPVAYLQDSPSPTDRSEELVRGRGWEVFGLLSGLLGAGKVVAPQAAPAIHLAIAFVAQAGAMWSVSVSLAAYYGLRRSLDG